jgi:hypothetical protein
MRKTWIAFAIALVLPITVIAAAAEIHGTVSDNGRPVGKGVVLKLDCGVTIASARTDEFGGYSIKVGATGECTLSVDYKNANGSLKVTVYEKPSRYDIDLRVDGGKLALTRK